MHKSFVNRKTHRLLKFLNEQLKCSYFDSKRFRNCILFLIIFEIKKLHFFRLRLKSLIPFSTPIFGDVFM